ncbi:ribonuclease Z [Priestia megaterium]|uniref:MBL fold metallo-hydrolase n=1 Tax=Priestia megaterium TaxID=1404 RepID=UPI000BFA6E68|nr:MBL fold metallo-hydrolase [Priestia megaterium]PFK99863.1 ribonuclease Z [Priestia megaterium]
MLNFIGRGSAFNTKEGNNCAYIKKGEHLLLIDCGSSTFSRLIESNLLDGVKNITVLITHLHPDHVGSLGDLIFYSYYSIAPMFERKVKVLVPTQIVEELGEILRLTGVESNTYDSYELGLAYDFNFDQVGLKGLGPISVEHAEELNCFGYVLFSEDKTIYYSGDSNMIPGDILKALENGHIDYFYQDTCQADYEGNVHLSLRKLTKLIPYELRHKVYCMHLDEKFNEQTAKDLGFNVVSITK